MSSVILLFLDFNLIYIFLLKAYSETPELNPTESDRVESKRTEMKRIESKWIENAKKCQPNEFRFFWTVSKSKFALSSRVSLWLIRYITSNKEVRSEIIIWTSFDFKLGNNLFKNIAK